ncbi:MAG: hypothetical protein KJ645_06020 [Planctomycetes bacterium]|nr:hypothetical protein [Planctomycetota bacterium]
MDKEIALKIHVLEREIERVEGKDLSLEVVPEGVLTTQRDPNIFFVSNRILGGTCFYELHEIERFILKRLQEKDNALVIHPPLNLGVSRTEDGVELSWSENPQNQALFRNLMNNPLLSLNYKVYRWHPGRQSQPEAIALLPYDRNTYVDNKIGPLEMRYFYNVLTVYGGKIGAQDTLIESQQSETVDLICNDRFLFKIVEGKPDCVQLKISIEIGGNQYSHIFSISVGDEIGGLVDLPELGRIDLSTTLTATAILTRQETREMDVDHPVFNSNGSRTLDPTTGKPQYEQRPVTRDVTVYTLVGEDPWGNVRRIE